MIGRMSMGRSNFRPISLPWRQATTPSSVLADLQLELEPALRLDRNVGMKHRAAGAQLADLADLADAAEHQRAGLKDRARIVQCARRRHLAGQRINGIQHPFALEIRNRAYFPLSKVYEV